MPRETIDSILDHEIEEEASRTIEFDFILECGIKVEVDLSEFDIFSMEDFYGSNKKDDAIDVLRDQYDIYEIHNGDFYGEEDTFMCVVSDERFHVNQERTVYDRRGYETSIHEDEDYIYSEDSDYGYLDNQSANENDVFSCSGCDEYRHSDNHDFEECRGDNDDENQRMFENSSVPSKSTKNNDYNRKLGITSTTFSNMNGMKYTFGVEIETSGGTIDHWSDLNCSAVNDGSISGKEFVTGVLVGDSGLSMLKKICERVKESCVINSSCGIHVHIGGAIFNRRFTIMATHLGLMLQDEVFAMLPSSRASNSYCKMIPPKYSNMNFQNYKDYLGELIYDTELGLGRSYNKKTRLGRYPSKRYSWLNMVGYSQASGHNTIEFRPHSASMSYEKIRNWTLICMSFTSFVENHQRRIWEAKDLPGGIKLDEVLRTSLGDDLGGQVSRYVESRKKEFNGAS
tara:strand:- start:898 stop:2265 length:1368 start_codon:yes stop_codon:yes gene_type:complete